MLPSLGHQRMFRPIPLIVAIRSDVDRQTLVQAVEALPCSRYAAMATNGPKFWMNLLPPGYPLASPEVPSGTSGCVDVVMRGESELLQVVDALGPPSRLASRLHRGKQQGDQHRDDGDDDEEFDQGESAPDPPRDRASVHDETPIEEWVKYRPSSVWQHPEKSATIPPLSFPCPSFSGDGARIFVRHLGGRPRLLGNGVGLGRWNRRWRGNRRGGAELSQPDTQGQDDRQGQIAATRSPSWAACLVQGAWFFETLLSTVEIPTRPRTPEFVERSSPSESC